MRTLLALSVALVVLAPVAACSSAPADGEGGLANAEPEAVSGGDCDATRTADGWCWATSNHPAGGGRFLAFADDDVWGTASGVLIHWDGKRWSPQKTSAHVDAIWGESADDLWGVEGWGSSSSPGKHSRIYRRQGRNADWVKVADVEASWLTSIWGSGPNDIWVVGTEGTVMHWDGTSWQRANDNKWASSAGFSSVHGTGPSDVWATGVGPTGLPDRQLHHWDGKTWTEIPESEVDSTSLKVVRAFAPDDVWTGGTRALYHFDGSAWTKLELPIKEPLGQAYEVLSISGPADDVMIGVGWMNPGKGLLFRYHGGQITQIDLPPDGERRVPRVHGLTRLPSGGLLFSRGAGDIYVRAADGTYTRQTEGPQIDFASASSAGNFVVGSGYAGAFAALDNGQWKLVEAPGASWLTSVAAFGPGVAVGAGAKAVARLASGVATVEGPLPRENVVGFQIAGLSPDDLWIAGSSGFWHWTSGTWSEAPRVANAWVRDVRSLIVDKDGAPIIATDVGVFRFDGAFWQELYKVGTRAILRAPDGALWGADQRGFYRDGQLQPNSEEINRSAGYVRSMAACPDGRLYAAGSWGRLLSFEKGAWKEEDAGTSTGDWPSVTCTADGTVWLFDREGMIFKKPR